MVFSFVFVLVNLLNKAITVYSCGNGFNVVVMAISAAQQQRRNNCSCLILKHEASNTVIVPPGEDSDHETKEICGYLQ